MTSDGTVISDPYLYVHKWDLFYLQFVVISWWPFWGIYVPICYGYDVYQYLRYGNENPAYSEAALFLGKIYNELVVEPQVTLNQVCGILTIAAAVAAFIPGIGQVAAAALGVTTAALYVAGVVANYMANIIYNEYLYSVEYNTARNLTFGVCQMERYHLVLSSNPYEYLSWFTLNVAYYDGGVKQVLPLAGVYYMDISQAWTYCSYFIAINNAVGFDHWVWLGPYIPI
ncbi:MAG: hypothetical protein QW279_05095 [Candidatus Jordarchaeaceae archaeon]